MKSLNPEKYQNF